MVKDQRPPIAVSPPDPPGGGLAKIQHAIARVFFHVAATGLIPARWFAPVPRVSKGNGDHTGRRCSLEVVSHCWQYPHLLAFQLSSLVLHPPRTVDLRMTVFHAAEDRPTTELLAWFSTHRVPGVEWHWQALSPAQLMRRGIGRNLAALATTADWVWFTDCDLVFGEGCLDALAQQLQGRRDLLVYPQQEYCTRLLPDGSPMLRDGRNPRRLLHITEPLTPRRVTRATGPLQITHGDAARQLGYCDALKAYQAPTDRWRKTYEDRAFRWLLGTQGVAIDVPGVQRIRHLSKGRYPRNRPLRWLRQRLRLWTEPSPRER